MIKQRKMGSRSSRLFIVLWHLVGISTNIPSSYRSRYNSIHSNKIGGITGVNTKSIHLERLHLEDFGGLHELLEEYYKKRSSNDTNNSNEKTGSFFFNNNAIKDDDILLSTPFWLQDDTDGKCYNGPANEFTECGDSTLFFIRPTKKQQQQKRHRGPAVGLGGIITRRRQQSSSTVDGDNNTYHYQLTFALQLVDGDDIPLSGGMIGEQQQDDDEHFLVGDEEKTLIGRRRRKQRNNNNKQKHHRDRRKKKTRRGRSRMNDNVDDEDECLLFSHNIKNNNSSTATNTTTASVNAGRLLQKGLCNSGTDTTGKNDNNEAAWSWRVNGQGILYQDMFSTNNHLLTQQQQQQHDQYMCLWRENKTNVILLPCNIQPTSDDDIFQPTNNRRLVSLSLYRYQVTSATTSSSPSSTTQNNAINNNKIHHSSNKKPSLKESIRLTLTNTNPTLLHGSYQQQQQDKNDDYYTTNSNTDNTISLSSSSSAAAMSSSTHQPPLRTTTSHDIAHIDATKNQSHQIQMKQKESQLLKTPVRDMTSSSSQQGGQQQHSHNKKGSGGSGFLDNTNPLLHVATHNQQPQIKNNNFFNNPERPPRFSALLVANQQYPHHYTSTTDGENIDMNNKNNMGENSMTKTTKISSTTQIISSSEEKSTLSTTTTTTTTSSTNIHHHKKLSTLSESIRMLKHPYIHANKNYKDYIWTDPQTGLRYHTDLTDYLEQDTTYRIKEDEEEQEQDADGDGSNKDNNDSNTNSNKTGKRKKKKDRHTLMGVGQYTRTVFKVKVYGVAFYVSKNDVLDDPSMEQYASLTTDELRASGDKFYKHLRTMSSSPITPGEGGLFDRTIVLKLNMQLSTETMRSSLEADWKLLSDEHRDYIINSTLKRRPAHDAMIRLIQNKDDNPSRCSCGQIAPEEYNADISCCSRGTELVFTWRKNGDLEARLDGRIMDIFRNVPGMAEGIFFEYLRTDDPISPDAIERIVDGFPFLLAPLNQVKGVSSPILHHHHQQQQHSSTSESQSTGGITSNVVVRMITNAGDVVSAQTESAADWVQSNAIDAASNVIQVMKTASESARHIADDMERKRVAVWTQVSQLPENSMNAIQGVVDNVRTRRDNRKSLAIIPGKSSDGHDMNSSYDYGFSLENRSINMARDEDIRRRGQQRRHVHDVPRGRIFFSGILFGDDNSVPITDEIDPMIHPTGSFIRNLFIFMVHLYLLLLLIVSFPAGASYNVKIRKTTASSSSNGSYGGGSSINNGCSASIMSSNLSRSSSRGSVSDISLTSMVSEVEEDSCTYK